MEDLDIEFPEKLDQLLGEENQCPSGVSRHQLANRQLLANLERRHCKVIQHFLFRLLLVSFRSEIRYYSA